jgi:O-antigen ligase
MKSKKFLTLVTLLAFGSTACKEKKAVVLFCIFASLVVIICYVGSKYSGIKCKRWVKISFICIAVAGMAALYSLKKDSADGRILIWQSTWNMVLDKPVAGHGYGAFNEKYMLYQADYFICIIANTDSVVHLLQINAHVN